MPDRIDLRRLIQQSAYLSDSRAGRRITGNFCTRFQLPNGKRRIWNCCRNRRQFTTKQRLPARQRYGWNRQGGRQSVPGRPNSIVP